VKEYPHDPNSFTQGLEYDTDCSSGTCKPVFWESTGAAPLLACDRPMRHMRRVCFKSETPPPMLVSVERAQAERLCAGRCAAGRRRPAQHVHMHQLALLAEDEHVSGLVFLAICGQPAERVRSTQACMRLPY